MLLNKIKKFCQKIIVFMKINDKAWLNCVIIETSLNV